MTEKIPGPSWPSEAFEPYETMRPIPLGVLMIAVALALWGGVLLFDNSEAVAIGQAERAEVLADQPVRSDADGATLFAARCATCHQPNGSGVSGAIPPLAGSPFLAGRPEVPIAILLRGIDGPIRVGNAVYDGHMPSFASVLSDEEIARLVSHVRERFAARPEPVAPVIVARLRSELAGRPAWRGGQELAGRMAPELVPQPSPALAGSSKADPATMRLVTEGRNGSWACASCHGALGQGSETVPRIAGLPAAYIARQLDSYVSGSRRNESMAVVARSLTRQERVALGDYYALLRAPSTAHPSLGGDIDRGRKLVLEGDWDRDIPACVSCHGPSAFGVAPGFPGLAAQHPAYTASQLTAWISGERDNARQKLMNGIARSLDDADRRAVADYLATLPPVPAAATKGEGR